MKSKTRAAISLVLLAFVLLFIWGYAGKSGSTASVQGQGGSQGEQSVLKATETIYDFGTISMKNGLVTNEFVITNPTERSIGIRGLVTSCMCTAAYLVRPDGTTYGPFGMPGMGSLPPLDDIVAPGESRVLRVVYDPNAHGPAGVGRIDRFIKITDESGAALEFEILANVTP